MKIDIDDFKSWHKEEIKKENKYRISSNERFQRSFYEIRDEDKVPTFYELEEYIEEKEISDQKGRYLIFSYENYYPSGGMEDLILQTNDLDNFIEAYHVTDGKLPNNLTCFDIETNTTFNLKERIKNGTHNSE